jgi:PPM family protein phosphatase
MSVQCSICGRLSQDLEFCDNCNADLGSSGDRLAPALCPVAGEGTPLTLEQRNLLSFPESAILVARDGVAARVHWISPGDWRQRGRALENRLSVSVPSLPTGRLIEDGSGRWLAFDTFLDRPLPWQQSIFSDPLQELQRLSAWVDSVAGVLEALHRQSLVWLNFDPNALEDLGPLDASSNGNGLLDRRRLRITNLDLELYPFGTMPERVRVHPHYAAPEIVQFRMDDISPRTDVFHLAMFAYYWLTGQLPDGLAGGGLERYDYALPHLRIFTPHLPEGIIPVVMRGLSIAPHERYESPRAFAEALAAGLLRVHERRSFTGRLSWDLGGHTRTGRSKTEAQRGNEDAILIKQDDESALALVADGVSTCDIGSGGLASMMTSIVIENALAEACSHDNFPAVIAAATERGSFGLLEWALAHDCRADLEAGKDLMGTTVTVAWLRGHELSVANLGDSRAYLVSGGTIEQLTVDGDLASDLLAQGAAPEEVRELGTMARALRECVGGCIKTDDGELATLPESAHPKVSRWPLMPGDVIVLCTDGLVEEGFFLEPATLATVVRDNPHLPASDLALLLVEAADALQRLPTILEPDGFGDNISCLVIKIKESV